MALAAPEMGPVFAIVNIGEFSLTGIFPKSVTLAVEFLGSYQQVSPFKVKEGEIQLLPSTS